MTRTYRVMRTNIRFHCDLFSVLCQCNQTAWYTQGLNHFIAIRLIDENVKNSIKVMLDFKILPVRNTYKTTWKSNILRNY